jgi:hypothetical protein
MLQSIRRGSASRPRQDFSGAEEFFDQGVLDSLDPATLVAEIESRYAVFVNPSSPKASLQRALDRYKRG